MPAESSVLDTAPKYTTIRPTRELIDEVDWRVRRALDIIDYDARWVFRFPRVNADSRLQDYFARSGLPNGLPLAVACHPSVLAGTESPHVNLLVSMDYEIGDDCDGMGLPKKELRQRLAVDYSRIARGVLPLILPLPVQERGVALMKNSDIPRGRNRGTEVFAEDGLYLGDSGSKAGYLESGTEGVLLIAQELYDRRYDTARKVHLALLELPESWRVVVGSGGVLMNKDSIYEPKPHTPSETEKRLVAYMRRYPTQAWEAMVDWMGKFPPSPDLIGVHLARLQDGPFMSDVEMSGDYRGMTLVMRNLGVERLMRSCASGELDFATLISCFAANDQERQVLRRFALIIRAQCADGAIRGWVTPALLDPDKATEFSDLTMGITEARISAEGFAELLREKVGSPEGLAYLVAKLTDVQKRTREIQVPSNILSEPAASKQSTESKSRPAANVVAPETSAERERSEAERQRYWNQKRGKQAGKSRQNKGGSGGHRNGPSEKGDRYRKIYR